MIQKINQRYQIDNSEAVVSVLKKMKEYDINYEVEIDKGIVRIRCFDMDVGQQNIISSFGKLVKKISFH